MLFSFFVALGASLRWRVTRGIAFGGQLGSKLDVYSPVGADGEAPVVVAAAGKRAAQALASRGFVAVVPHLGADAREPDSIKTFADAVVWARVNVGAYGGHPRRLFAMGRDHGAYAAAMLALDPRWRAAGDLLGAIGVCGVYVSAHDEPARYARAGAPPLLLIARDRDRADPARHTGPLASALRTVGVQVAEICYPKLANRMGLHSFVDALRLRATPLDEVERFIRLRSLGVG